MVILSEFSSMLSSSVQDVTGLYAIFHESRRLHRYARKRLIAHYGFPNDRRERMSRLLTFKITETPTGNLDYNGSLKNFEDWVRKRNCFYLSSSEIVCFPADFESHDCAYWKIFQGPTGNWSCSFYPKLYDRKISTVWNLNRCARKIQRWFREFLDRPNRSGSCKSWKNVQNELSMAT